MALLGQLFSTYSMNSKTRLMKQQLLPDYSKKRTRETRSLLLAVEILHSQRSFLVLLLIQYTQPKQVRLVCSLLQLLRAKFFFRSGADAAAERRRGICLRGSLAAACCTGRRSRRGCLAAVLYGGEQAPGHRPDTASARWTGSPTLLRGGGAVPPAARRPPP